MTYEIQASVREAQGTGASRRLRREGQIPGILYGEGQEPVAIAVVTKRIYSIGKRILSTHALRSNCP